MGVTQCAQLVYLWHIILIFVNFHILTDYLYMLHYIYPVHCMDMNLLSFISLTN